MLAQHPNHQQTKKMSSTTLTRSALLKIGSPRTEKIHIDGIGEAMVRSVPESKQRSRNARYYDLSGNMTPEWHKSTLYQIVDQLCDPDGAPMFTDADLPDLEELDVAVLSRITSALEDFNGKKLNAGSTTS